MTYDPLCGAGSALLAAYADLLARHQPWHMIVPESVGGGFGWCIDCLRIVPCNITPPESASEVQRYDGLDAHE